jgi:hypothetical protein
MWKEIAWAWPWTDSRTSAGWPMVSRLTRSGAPLDGNRGYEIAFAPGESQPSAGSGR